MTGGGGGAVYCNCYPVGIDGYFQWGGGGGGNGQNHELRKAKEKCSRTRHCQLLSPYCFDGI